MAPKYKLTYFNATGLAEPIRYLLHYAKIEFEDCRFEHEDWPKRKASTLFGQVPTLEIDGKQVCQSSAICRYLANQLGLLGKTPWDALQADIIVDTVSDLRLHYSKFFREKNEEEKEKILQEIRTTHNPFYLAKFEEIVKKNGGHFVDGQLTWADIYFAAITDLLNNVLKEQILDSFPGLAALKKKVDSFPGIKEHREKRPQTV